MLGQFLNLKRVLFKLIIQLSYSLETLTIIAAAVIGFIIIVLSSVVAYKT